MLDNDSGTPACEVNPDRRLTPSEAALFIGASDMLTDRAKRLVNDYEALADEVAALRAERARIEHDPRVVAVLRLLSERMESNLRSDLLAAIRGGDHA